MGRKQSISKNVSERELVSEVKEFKHGGAYIPLPQKYIGRKVKLIFGNEGR